MIGFKDPGYESNTSLLMLHHLLLTPLSTTPDYTEPTIYDITLTYSGQRLVRADDSAPRCGFSGAMDFLDGDLRIFLSESDPSETGIPIGVTPVETSFYNSDVEGGKWMKGAIIDPNDNSGIDFINSMLNDTPGVWNYSWNAYGGQLYDFKVTNGTETKEDDNKGLYRGMPVPIGRTPMLPVYCSARDIGNMMAGYVMGYNGLPWGVVRRGFDGLESLQKGKTSTEGASSQNAQKYGYRWGLNQRINSEGKVYPHAGYVFMKVFYETMIRML